LKSCTCNHRDIQVYIPTYPMMKRMIYCTL